MIYFSDFGAASTIRKIEPVQVVMRTGTGTQDITLSGFGTPTGAIFILTRTAATGTEASSPRMSFGATDGTNHFCVANSFQATEQTGQKFTSTRVAGELNPNGDTDDSVITFDSWITDGVRINVTDAQTSACHLTVWLIGGGATVKVGTYAPHTTAITQTAGFEANMVMLMGTGVALGSAQNTCIWNYGIGTWDGSTVRQCGGSTAFSTPSGSGQNVGKIRNDKIATFYSSGLSEGSQSPITFGNVTATTFDLTGASNSASALFGWIAIGGLADVWCGVFVPPSSTGTLDFTDVSVGFTPTMTMVTTNRVTALNTNYTDGHAGSVGFGCATVNGAAATSWRTKDNIATEEAYVAADAKLALNVWHANAQSTYSHVGVLSAFKSNGMTVNFTTADAADGQWIVAYAA